MIGKPNIKLTNPKDTGLYSNIGLGPSTFRKKNLTDLQKGWDICYNSLEKTFLKNVTTPYAVYFSVGPISFLDSDQAILYDSSRPGVEKHGLKFYLFEPLSTYKKNSLNNRIYVDYENDEIDYIYSYELDSIQTYAKRNNLTNVEVYSPSYKLDLFFQKKYPELKLMCTPIGWVYPATVSVEILIPNVDQITKKFWCGNWRYAAHRHLIASYLIKNVGLTDCNLSWIYKSSDKILQDNLWTDLNRFDNRIKLDILSGVNLLDKVSPLSMDITIDKKLEINESINLHINTNPKNFYQESFCAIVTETRFAESTCILTEKIFNAMINCKPFILVGPPGSLSYLKKWGFETFNNWFDESYDDEVCHHKRFEKITSIIDYINSKSITELKKMYNNMFEILYYNQHRILDLQQELLHAPITKNKLFKKVRYAN